MWNASVRSHVFVVCCVPKWQTQRGNGMGKSRQMAQDRVQGTQQTGTRSQNMKTNGRSIGRRKWLCCESHLHAARDAPTRCFDRWFERTEHVGTGNKGELDLYLARQGPIKSKWKYRGQSAAGNASRRYRIESMSLWSNPVGKIKHSSSDGYWLWEEKEGGLWPQTRLFPVHSSQFLIPCQCFRVLILFLI